MKVLFLKGLPASGKSTYAKELVDTQKNWKRVNKDDIRAMLDNSKWSKANEKMVIQVRDSIILTAITSGYNIVIDDTNLSPTHIPHIKEIIEHTGLNVEYEEKFFDTPLAECIRRDMLRPNPVGKKVIRRMYDTIKDLYEPKIEYNPSLPDCIIVDIDGTLAHMNGRSPYDYSKVSTDIVDPVVSDIVRRYRQTDPIEENPLYVVIVSGREDGCKAETEQWLQDNYIPYDELHMRKADDSRDDRIVKKEIYDEWIKKRYNVKFVLDDRNRVVEMWRSLGLKVLQVGEGDF